MTIDLLQSLEGSVTLPGGKKLKVKGLTLKDVSILAKRNKSELSHLFDLHADNPNSDVLAVLLNSFPRIASEIICLGLSYELTEDNVNNVEDTVPAPLQVNILYEVGRITFYTEDALKKCVEAVVAAMNVAAQQLETVTASMNSSAVSERK